ncbi:VOC family protein [Camelimonas abortus]|uniref:VOC family protein n=1 Tax=Camelimonas abortus TaxID=1017184 RepID=A0ABV7LDN7_9HYPH
MFSHVVLGTNDLQRARKFYDATLAALGVPPGVEMHVHAPRVYYRHNGMTFVVTAPVNGEPATAANGGTVGFAAPSGEAIEAWHAAGLANGGTTCEDPPGVRDTPRGRFYLGYLRDPDGNKLCAFHPLS